MPGCEETSASSKEEEVGQGVHSPVVKKKIKISA